MFALFALTAPFTFNCADWLVVPTVTFPLKLLLPVTVALAVIKEPPTSKVVVGLHVTIFTRYCLITYLVITPFSVVISTK